ncbi:MAG: PH domain-containing protein [Rhodomicrobium sp.]
MFGILSIILTLSFLLPLTLPTLGVAPLIYCLLVFRGSKARMETAEKKTEATLMQDEKIVVKGVQQRAYALLKRRTFIALTNNRVIMMSRGIFGGFNIKSFQWKNIVDVSISEHIFSGTLGTDLRFTYFVVPDDPNSPKDYMNFFGLPDGVAARGYAQAQTEQQAWQEKRRIRTMEQNRAIAGGTYISTATQAQTNSISGVASELSNAKKMMDEGVISNSEFQELKSKLLNKGSL